MQPAPSSKDKDFTVGAYVVFKDKIGSGNFAKVFRGRHIKEGYPVAVKAIDLRLASKAQAETEVHEMDKLQGHPNIIKLYSTHGNDRYICVILEYCGGGDLSECVKTLADTRARERRRLRKEEKERRSRLAEATGGKGGEEEVPLPKRWPTPSPAMNEYTVRRLGAQLISAMCFLNSKRVLHRDLKPANLLLTDKDLHKADLRVADLGFARGSSDMAVSTLGTAYYMAPERLRGSQYNFQAEVWAVGLILYEMFYGQQPYEASNEYKLLEKIHTEPLTFPAVEPEPSNAFKDLVRQMIVEDPEQRITIDAAKDHSWFTVELADPSMPEPASNNQAHGDDAGLDDTVLEEDEDARRHGRAQQKVNPQPTGHPQLSGTPVKASTSARMNDHQQPQQHHHVDPSLFSVPLMRDDVGGRQADPGRGAHQLLPKSGHSLPPALPPLKQQHQQNGGGDAAAVDHGNHFPEAIALPPANSAAVIMVQSQTSGASRDAASGVPQNYSLSSNPVGSLTRGSSCIGGGGSPVPQAHTISPQLTFSDSPPLAMPSVIYQPVPVRRTLERALVVKWAAENHPKRAHQVQLYQYAAQVAANFEPTSPPAAGRHHDDSDVLRDVCLHRATLLFNALSPAERHAPPRGVCAFATARLWMHTIHDARVVKLTSAVEMETIYRAAQVLCDIVSEDPTTEVNVRNQAGTMRELIHARWLRIVEGVSPPVLFP